MVSTRISEHQSSQRVAVAIRNAAARTGVDFAYLFNQARVESGFRPNARAATSSATGLFQFIDQTWLATVNRHGDQFGLGWAAEAISRTRSGGFNVADPQMRATIMNLRNDPEIASMMAGAFASDNRDHLEQQLGRQAAPVDLYLAHFLGAGGATSFLRAYDANPSAPAASLLPQAARANRSIFYNRQGQPRSLAEIRDRFAEKLNAGGLVAPSGAAYAAGPGPAPPAQWRAMPSDQLMNSASPSLARLAYLSLASFEA